MAPGFSFGDLISPPQVALWSGRGVGLAVGIESGLAAVSWWALGGGSGREVLASIVFLKKNYRKLTSHTINHFNVNK